MIVLNRSLFEDDATYSKELEQAFWEDIIALANNKLNHTLNGTEIREIGRNFSDFDTEEYIDEFLSLDSKIVYSERYKKDMRVLDNDTFISGYKLHFVFTDVTFSVLDYDFELRVEAISEETEWVEHQKEVYNGDFDAFARAIYKCFFGN